MPWRSSEVLRASQPMLAPPAPPATFPPGPHRPPQLLVLGRSAFRSAPYEREPSKRPQLDAFPARLTWDLRCPHNLRVRSIGSKPFRVVIALLAFIALALLIYAEGASRRFFGGTKSTRILNDLRLIDAAREAYWIESVAVPSTSGGAPSPALSADSVPAPSAHPSSGEEARSP